MEVKYGFVPGVDNAAYRVRRRYRLLKGGHPQLVLIHYSRGQSMRKLYVLLSPFCHLRILNINDLSLVASHHPLSESARSIVSPSPHKRASGVCDGR